MRTLAEFTRALLHKVSPRTSGRHQPHGKLAARKSGRYALPKGVPFPTSLDVKHFKHRLVSKTESAVFTVAFATLIVALIASLFLAQHFLIGTAQYWDFLRVERYLRLCQMALEAEARAWPSEESLQKLRDIGLYPDVYPPDHEIPRPNPRYVPAIESVEIWGHIRDAEGKPVAVLRLSRHDINTRHTVKMVRLYTLVGAVGGTILIGIIGLFLHQSIIRRLSGISREIEEHLPPDMKTEDEDPLERLSQSVRAMIGSQVENAAKSRAILDGHTELAVVGTGEGTLVDVNEAYCRYFGVKREEVIGSNYLDCIQPAYRMEVLNHLRSLSAAAPAATIDHPVTLPDGSTRWLRWRDKAVVGRDGRVLEIISFGTDISAERELSDRIEGLRVAFDQMQSLAETGSLTWDFAEARMEWTPETRRLLGVEASTPASIDGLLAVVAPDDRESVRRLFREAKELGRNFQHEFRAVLADGSLRVLQSRAEVLADPKTKLLNHLTCTLRDITALRDAEAATKRELRFREAVESSLAVGIVVRDMKGCTLSANPAFTKMVGFSEQELIAAKPPQEPYWPDDQRQTIEAALAQALAGTAPKEGFQLVFNRRDQIRFDALVAVAPVRDDQGVPYAMLGAVTDISALQQVRRELQETNERMRIAQDVVGLGIWDWDPLADTLFWDKHSFAIFGHPEAADPKKVWAAVLSEEEQERLTYELKRLIDAGGVNGQDRLCIRWPDGSEHHSLSTYVILRDSSGKANRVIGVNRDVTTELEQERELRVAQERLSAALEGGKFGTFEHVFGLGAVNWNSVNYEIHGIDPAITDPDKLFRAWLVAVGDGYPAIEQTIASLSVDQTSVTYDFDIRLPRTGEKRRIRSSVFIERNKNGHPVRLVGVSRRLD